VAVSIAHIDGREGNFDNGGVSYHETSTAEIVE
jgi:hypothetical protein